MFGRCEKKPENECKGDEGGFLNFFFCSDEKTIVFYNSGAVNYELATGGGCERKAENSFSLC
jgi:hypothetical protein